MNFETLFVNPNGRTVRTEYVPALLTVLATIAFFTFVVPGRTSQFCMLVLLYPVTVLLARRLRDMGYSVWLLLVPLALMLVAFGIWLGYVSLGEAVDDALPSVALAVSAVFLLWACVKK
jgi:uncharacterized membrane protein YhaH (DUF805 family)